MRLITQGHGTSSLRYTVGAHDGTINTLQTSHTFIVVEFACFLVSDEAINAFMKEGKRALAHLASRPTDSQTFTSDGFFSAALC